MIAKELESPPREITPFNPHSPDSVAHVLAPCITVDYREAHVLHASSGILFNHESSRPSGTFVTRKVMRAVAAILKGEREYLSAGNLDDKRDWATRASASRRSGEWSSGMTRTTTSSPRARCTPPANSTGLPSVSSGRPQECMCAWMPRTSARPRSASSAATRARWWTVSAGGRKLGSANLTAPMLDADLQEAGLGAGAGGLVAAWVAASS